LERSGRFHKVVRLIERGEQRVDLFPQAIVAGASRGEPSQGVCAFALMRRLTASETTREAQGSSYEAEFQVVAEAFKEGIY
jgi:hypothetical protein